MKTLTFYSYKGGVGRSLVCANLAQRLVEFGKSVCVLDFDLEAPGMPFKFGARKILDMKKKGVVDFVTEYQQTLAPPQTLGHSYIIRLNEDRKNQAPLHLITAGNTDTAEYWKHLAALDWKDLFYSKNGQGYRLMLHLKALIEREVKPDYLLIDSRTGVTETSSIALAILADRVVMVAANNEENLYGTKLIIKGIQRDTHANGKKADVHFILSRVPFTKEPNDRIREWDRINALAKELKDEGLEIASPGILLIHSERELEERESLKISEFKTEEPVHIGDDYRKIFKHVISQDFVAEEQAKFEKQEEANRLYSGLNKEQEIQKKLDIINRCIELSPIAEYYYERAQLSIKMSGPEDGVIKDFEMALDLDPFFEDAYFNLILYLSGHNKQDECIKIIDAAISKLPNKETYYFARGLFGDDFKQKEKDLLIALSLDESNALFLRSLIELYFSAEKYDLAYEHAYKALEEHSKNGEILYLLAKLQSAYKHNEDEFYLYLDRALEAHKDISDRVSSDEFFRPFLNEERFKRLLYKYNIEMKLPPEAPVETDTAQ